MDYNIAPTKSNLLSLKETLKFAKEGYDLLEEKRQFLVMELMHYVGRAKIVEKELEEKLTVAYESLRKAILTNGNKFLMANSSEVSLSHSLHASVHRVMGIDIPAINYMPPKLDTQFSLLSSCAREDDLMIRFIDVLKTIAQLAEVRAAVMKLAGEVRKTQRRVNALDKIVIPDTQSNIKYIEMALEEKDRDELFVKKLIKAKKEARA